MRLSDRIAGTLIALFGSSVIWGAQALARIPGVRFGPALMPTLIGIGLVVLGEAIALNGFLDPERRTAPLADLSDWAVPTRQRLAALWALGGPVAGIAVFGSVGFPLFALVYVAGLMVLMGARPLVVLTVAPLTVLALYLGFSEGLHVPLPAGWLAGVLPRVPRCSGRRWSS